MLKKNYAKINLALNIEGKLPNGYHALDMLNICVSLHDIVSLKINKSNIIKIICTHPDVPVNEKNSIYKVIEKFQKTFHFHFGCIVKIKKNIPMQAGLAGGSGNAAATLRLLNHHFHTNLSFLEMSKFIVPITADGPYLLYSVPCRVKGIGEQVKPIQSSLQGKIFLLKPKSGCNTKEVFQNLPKKSEKANMNKLQMALQTNDINLLAKHCKNALLESACNINPEILTTLNTLKKLGFEAIGMSGSGSTCFGISSSKEPYKNAKLSLVKDEYDLCGAYRIFSPKQ